MSRVLVVLVAALALAGALLWFATASRTPRGARGELQAAEEPASAKPNVAPAALADAPAAPSPALEPRAAPEPPHAAQREESGALAAELARAQWIAGRVVFPPGTPADEEVFVTAEGRGFPDKLDPRKKDQRVRVERDGTFRVAFSESARTGRFALDAHYLYLDGIVRWKSKESDGTVVLEPKLGARIAGTLVPPAGVDPRSISGKVQLQWIEKSGNDTSESQLAEHEISAELSFAFESLVPASTARTYEIDYDGERLIGSSGTLTPVPGKTLAIELALRPGVALSGVVRDPEGKPVPGANVTAHVESRSRTAPSSRTYRNTDSAADGTFRLGALAPGKIKLTARLERFEPLERDLGALEEKSELADLELVLGRGLALSGTVRWPDGSPAEASLELLRLNEGLSWSHTEIAGKCDANGAFTITGLEDAAYRVTAHAAKSEEVTVTSEITGRTRTKKAKKPWSAEIERVKAGTRDLALTLSSGLTLEGRVRDENGAGVADFRIEATRVDGGNHFMGSDLAKAFRDTDGSFRMEGFAEGDWTLTAKSHGFAESEPVRVALPASEPVVLVVTHEALVSGRVVDPSGAPVAEAVVEASRATGFGGLRFNGSGSATTDEQGSFELRGLSAGVVQLQASATGFAPSEPSPLELAAGGSAHGLVLALRHGGTVVGDVVDADGRPDANVTVWFGADKFSASPETDAEGKFEASGVPPGDVHLTVQTSEGLYLQENVTVAAGETVHVRLAASATVVHLHGHVRAGGEAIAHAHVNAFRMRQEGDAGGGSFGSSTAETSDDGSYELSVAGAGHYQVSVYRGEKSSVSWSVSVDVPEVESFEYDLAVPLGHISGRVTDTHGTPLAGILVDTEPEQHEDDEPHGSSQATTDADGRYELEVPVGRHAVRAGGGDGWRRSQDDTPYAEARVGGLVVAANAHLRGVDLRLEAGGTLEGVVRNADGSLAGHVWISSLCGGEVHQLGYTDENGGYRIHGVTVGVHEVSAQDMSGGSASREPARVEIVAGETRHLDLVLAPAMSARVFVRQNGALVGSEIRVVDDKGRRQMVRSGQSGNAWVGPLVPGRYTFTAEREGKKAEKVVEVPASGEGPLEVELVFE